MKFLMGPHPKLAAALEELGLTAQLTVGKFGKLKDAFDEDEAVLAADMLDRGVKGIDEQLPSDSAFRSNVAAWQEQEKARMTSEAHGNG